MRALLMALLLALSATVTPTAALAEDEGQKICEYLSPNNYFCL